MARKHIVAAGGILVRPGPAPLIAIVQRRKDRVWVLPKGKLEADEEPIDGARREVIEETGHDVVVHEFLGVVTYPARGSVKVAQFWRMEPLDRPLRPLMRDIRAVDWLPLADALAELGLPYEQAFLDGIGAHAVAAAIAAAEPARAIKTAPAIQPVPGLPAPEPAPAIAAERAPAIVPASPAGHPEAATADASPEPPGLLRRLVRGWFVPR